MKKIFTLSLCFLLALSLAGQYNEPVKISTEIKPKLNHIIWKIWDSNTNQWVDDFKRIYLYDTVNNTINSFGFLWKKNTSQWINTPELMGGCDIVKIHWYNSKLTYDTNGNTTQEISYKYDKETEMWIEDTKREYSYDTDKNLTEIIIYKWDIDNNQWIDSWKHEYINNNNTKINKIIFSYEYDIDSNQWLLKYNTKYIYDLYKNKTERILYEWNDNTSIWVEVSKEEFAYDSYGNLIQEICYNWDEENSLWIIDTKTEYFYNTLYNFSDLIYSFQLFVYNSRRNIPINETVYRYKDGSWVKSESVNYYYSGLNTNEISESSPEEIQIYPNPASDYIIIDMNNNIKPATFELYDINCKKILSQEISGNSNKLLVSHLTKGMYLYNVINSSKTYSGKIIIK